MWLRISSGLYKEVGSSPPPVSSKVKPFK